MHYNEQISHTYTKSNVLTDPCDLVEMYDLYQQEFYPSYFNYSVFLDMYLLRAKWLLVSGTLDLFRLDRTSSKRKIK